MSNKLLLKLCGFLGLESLTVENAKLEAALAQCEKERDKEEKDKNDLAEKLKRCQEEVGRMRTERAKNLPDKAVTDYYVLNH